MDITNNIRDIEKLKCEILANISGLYDDMLKPGNRRDDRLELLSNIIICSYVLSSRLGIDYERLDEAIKSKLRLIMINEGHYDDDCKQLLAYLNSEKI